MNSFWQHYNAMIFLISFDQIFLSAIIRRIPLYKPQIHQKHSFFEFSSNTKSNSLPMKYFHRIHIDSYTEDFDLKNCPSVAYQQSVRTVQRRLTKTRTWFVKYFFNRFVSLVDKNIKKLNVSNGSIHKKIWWLIVFESTKIRSK